MEDKCKDCTNDKGCINCEDGNMHEVKKKKPEGALKELLDNIDTFEYEKTRREMLKETACEDLEKAVQAYSNLYNDECFDAIGNEYPHIKNAFKAGANWQKVNLWKDAQGDDLPEIDREVIVLYQRYPLEGNEYAVGFAHRPKEYWDGKNIDTGEVTRYYPKRYDKGGWNSPNIKWWLDCPYRQEHYPKRNKKKDKNQLELGL